MALKLYTVRATRVVEFAALLDDESNADVYVGEAFDDQVPDDNVECWLSNGTKPRGWSGRDLVYGDHDGDISLDEAIERYTVPPPEKHAVPAGTSAFMACALADLPSSPEFRKAIEAMAAEVVGVNLLAAVRWLREHPKEARVLLPGPAREIRQELLEAFHLAYGGRDEAHETRRLADALDRICPEI